MKSLTIHGLDETVARMIENKARSEGLSLNKTIKKLLEESLGLRPAAAQRHEEYFAEFLGVWNKQDLKEFDRAARTLRPIDEEDWR